MSQEGLRRFREDTEVSRRMQEGSGRSRQKVKERYRSNQEAAGGFEKEKEC